jgi:hypothetical protein
MCMLGVVGGSAAGLLIPPQIKQSKLFLVTQPVADLPALPCKHQAWPNADRECLTWTAPRREAEQVISGPNENAVATARIVEPVAVVENAPPPPIVAERQSVPAAKQVTAPQLAAASNVAPRPAARSMARIAAHARKPRTADRRTQQALGVVRSFSDNLSDVPATSFASDRTRRSIIRPTSIQDVYFYEQRGLLPPSTAPIAPQ